MSSHEVERFSDHDDFAMFNDALEYRRLSYCTIPLKENSKIPAIAWAQYQQRLPTLDELAQWFDPRTRHNLAVVTGRISGGLLVVDFDDLSLAADYEREFREFIRTIVLTPRPGVHFWHRAPGARNTQGDKIDRRGEGGIVGVPPSIIDGTRYRFADGHGPVPAEELCELPQDLLPQRRPLHTVVRPDCNRLQIIGRAMKYAEAMAPAISGQHGHDATFRFACKMVHPPPRGFGLSLSEAWPITLAFNSRCQPPWREDELRRKLEEALKKA